MTFQVQMPPMIGIVLSIAQASFHDSDAINSLLTLPLSSPSSPHSVSSSLSSLTQASGDHFTGNSGKSSHTELR